MHGNQSVIFDLHLSELKPIPSMETITRLCSVCTQELAADAPSNRQYCSNRCRDRASKRRSKGQPIADPTATPEEIANLRKQLVQQQNANVQLQKELAKAHQKVATANRRADRKHAAIAIREQQIADEKQLHETNLQAAFARAQQLNVQLQNELTAEQVENAKLRASRQDPSKYLQLLKDHQELTEYVTTLTRLYQSLYSRWYTLQSNYVLVCKDFLDFATYVSQTKPQHKLSPQDFDRFKRAKALRQKMPMIPRRKQPRMPQHPHSTGSK